MKNIIIDIQNPLKNINYICFDENTKEAIIIDPTDAKIILDNLENNELIPKVLFKTHNHFDHTAGIEEILKKFPLIKYINYEEVLKSNYEFEREYNFTEKSEIKIKIINLFGHTLDHIGLVCSFNNDRFLFSGDTIFHYGIGNIKNGGDINLFYETICRLKKNNYNITHFFPAHNYLKKNLEFMYSVLDVNYIQKNLGDLKNFIKSEKYDDAKNLNFDFNEQLEKNIFFQIFNRKIIDQLNNKNSEELFINLRSLRDVF